MMREALLYEKLDGLWVRCHLCAHECLIPNGGRGRCLVRVNRGGTLGSLVYGQLIAEAVDPIEKKPLFHFLPGSLAYSVAALGCNFRCAHCQNHTIAQPLQVAEHEYRGRRASPESVVAAAIRSGCKTIAYTYTEPTVYFEFALDVARCARERGLRNVFVSNGFMMPAALELIAPVLDGINIDVKGIRDRFYREVAGGALEPVLRALRACVSHGIWVEVTTLVIPGMNDGEEELRDTAQVVADISPSIPWHVSRFFPAHRLRHLPPTPVATLRRAQAHGHAAGLHFVYLGNVPGEGEDTLCPGCGEVVIRRSGYRVVDNRLIAGRCPTCQRELEGVWVKAP